MIERLFKQLIWFLLLWLLVSAIMPEQGIVWAAALAGSALVPIFLAGETVIWVVKMTAFDNFIEVFAIFVVCVILYGMVYREIMVNVLHIL